ncbi:MAG: hypothetical protein ACTHJR_20215 [Sphingomonas sp.]|uniref:hypothetical protein n=1 Tax=Sphingomonas sp. TaxID=28214 RepID=UPI003F81F976
MPKATTAALVTRFAVILFAAAAPAVAQNVVDPNADTSVADPAFPIGKGPVVLVDSGHDENQTLAGNYAPFGAVLTHDGYVVRDFAEPISAVNLAGASLLVIAEPRDPKDPSNAPKYQSTSAFTTEEIATLTAWVKSGGALLMIADHPPYAGSLRALAGAFGFEIEMYAAQKNPNAEFFSFANGDLVEGPLTRGLPQIQTFYGAAFTAPAAATPLLRFDSSWKMLVTDKPPRPMTPQDLRGATLEAGAGRVVLLGEGGAWSAQIGRGGKYPIGFNAPGAKGNKQFIRNVVRWLATGDVPRGRPANPAG